MRQKWLAREEKSQKEEVEGFKSGREQSRSPDGEQFVDNV
jgi:hypothetical protein